MNCPNCHTVCGENDCYCYRCGTPLQEEAVPAPPKKGSHWVPILILVILSALGMLLYFATAGKDTPPKNTFSHQSDTPWFSLENGTLYFDEFLYTGGSELSVPSEVEGQAVIALGEGCFLDCDTLTAVFLPDTLLSIENDAFAGCDSLRGIYIPASVQRIGSRAFYNCAGLEAVCIPDSISQVGERAFAECNSLYYIFYLGDYDEWAELYGEFINPYTGVFCEDGSFYQGGDPW